LNSSQSSLTSSNNQYHHYNGHTDNSSTANYSTSSAMIYNRSNGYNQQLNGYSNGISNAMLDSSAFDKNSSNNLIDFHSSIKSEPTNLDTYLADPYSSYEPESKRFHAMSNC